MSSDKLHTVYGSGTQGDETYHPSQSNHESCFIPECVRQYKDEPLYIIVAWWCLYQQGWVHRQQIAEAFRIPGRRASYLIAYLRNKATRVVCYTREVMLVNNIRRYEIHVTQVMNSRPRQMTGCHPGSRRTRQRVGNAASLQAISLWNQIHADRTMSHDDNDMKEGDDETSS
ncbi:CaiF/GrlA family transcriptional regulator [Salmonella enterica]